MLFPKFTHFYLDADGGAGGGTPPTDPPADSDPKDFDAWLKGQDEKIRAMFDQHVSGLKSALSSERDARKKLEDAEKTAQKEREQLEQEALVKNQEWQKLAEQREARIKELEPMSSEMESLKAANTRYAEVIQAQLAGLRKGLPEHIIALLDRLEPLDQLDYIAKNSDALGKKGALGVDPTPPPADPAKVSDQQKQEARAGFRKQVRNWF
jgi:hypothetical protein